MEGVFEEVQIAEDGKSFEVTVHGLKGAGCTKLQEKYATIGKQTAAQLTGEYYERAGTTVQQTVNAGVK
jgi:hypothetical protein